MYKILMLACLFISAGAVAQVTQGKVVFERVINMHKDLPPEAEQFKERIPEFQKSKMELLFNADQSLFRPVKEDDAQLPEGDGQRRGGFMMMMGGAAGNAETFRDYPKEQVIESRELGPKKYLIEDTLHPLKWKLEDGTKTILGYACKKATTTIEVPQRMGFRTQQQRDGQAGTGNAAHRDSIRRQPPVMVQQPVEVWYAEGLESQGGPDNYFGLPGLILSVSINNGSMVYNALSVEPGDAGKTVKAPTSGKKISRAEYRALAQQEFRNMGGPGGGGRRVEVRVQ